MPLEPNRENFELASKVFLEEMIDSWGNGEPFEGNVKNIMKIREMTGWDISDSNACYRTLIHNHFDDLEALGYSILGPSCIYRA